MTEADCRAVNCSEIDLSTCRPFPYESYSNESEEYLAEDQLNLYDEDGCFYTDMLRSTRRYETYMNFSLCMGILTIGKSLLSTLNISRSTLIFLVSGSFGLVGNLVNIIVLCSQEMRAKCFNNLLTVLNITDRS